MSKKDVDGVWVGDSVRSASLERLCESALNTSAGRIVFGAGAVSISRLGGLLGRPYFAAQSSLWAERILTATGNGLAHPFLVRHNRSMISEMLWGPGINPLRNSFLKSPKARQIARMFDEFGSDDAVRLRFPRKDNRPERQGDLIILKEPLGHGEKGVILLSYNESFYRAAAIFDLELLANDYRFVLEPSFWGYQDPAILLFRNLPTDVIVQCQSRPDRDYISEVKGNLIPVEFGAGDWVDDSVFSESNVFHYDVVMVANWSAFKRHRLLFRELRIIKGRVSNVALIGYPANGRTREDIVREADEEGVLDMIHIFEQIPHEFVAKILQHSKVAVMLTKREGANRAFYEALFSNVPVIVTSQNIGMNHDHINMSTGVFAADDSVGDAILHLINNRSSYRPREWALKNTGAVRTSALLNDVLRTTAEAYGEPWTCDVAPKKNAPNPTYTHEQDRVRLESAYGQLARYRRARSLPSERNTISSF